VKDSEKEKLSHEGSISYMRKRKYSAELIIKIVKENIENGVGSRTLAAQYNIQRGIIDEWIVQYKHNGAKDFLPEEQNRVYSIETKLQAVEDYLSGKGSQREITAKYGIRDRTILRQWIKVYNSGKGFRHHMSGGSRMKETRPTTVEERIQIAKDCISNGDNYSETALKYHVSYQQVYQWTRKFKEMGATGLEDRRGKRLKDQTPRTREEELEIEVAKLKHELYMTRMERDVLKKLDEIERREAYRK
jgi:transposase-like protein